MVTFLTIASYHIPIFIKETHFNPIHLIIVSENDVVVYEFVLDWKISWFNLHSNQEAHLASNFSNHNQCTGFIVKYFSMLTYTVLLL